MMAGGEDDEGSPLLARKADELRKRRLGSVNA